MRGALGIMEGRGTEENRRPFLVFPSMPGEEGGSDPLGVLGGPAVQAGQGERRISRQTEARGREDGKKGPRWGSTRLTCTGLTIVGGEGLLRGSPRGTSSPIQQSADNQLRLEEVLTLILETLRHKQGGRREDHNALLKRGQQPAEVGQTSSGPPASGAVTTVSLSSRSFLGLQGL